MSDTRTYKCAKGLLLLIFLATPLFVSVLPEFSWNNGMFLNSEGSNGTPKSAAIPELGFDRFWVNGTQFQENNTLYAHVGDTLKVRIETGTGISGPITVSCQQIGGSGNFDGSLSVLVGNVYEGDLVIPADTTTAELGLYRASLIKGKGFNFHLNISHAPPIITDITLWDPAFKLTTESVADGGTYDTYRSATVYANITYKIRSTALFSDTPNIAMRYDDGDGGETIESVTYTNWPASGTYTCAAPAINLLPNTNNQWQPGIYPLDFTVHYDDVLDGFAQINLNVLNAPPNITLFNIYPTQLPLPADSTQNISVTLKVTDPDDDILYGDTAVPVTIVQGGAYKEESTGVSRAESGRENDLLYDDNNYTRYTFDLSVSERYAYFQMSLADTNITNIDASSAEVGFKVRMNTTTPTGALLQIYRNSTKGWVDCTNFRTDAANTWVYHEYTILTPYPDYMDINNTQRVVLRIAAYDTTDLQIDVDCLNVTYTTTRRPGVTGVRVTVYNPYTRSNKDTNHSRILDRTECYDDISDQWMFNISFTGNEKGPYSIRVDVYDHGTAPYLDPSLGHAGIDLSDFMGAYSAGFAIQTRSISIGGSYSNVTKITSPPIWGSTPTGMTVNRGEDVTLAVQINDNAFAVETDVYQSFNSNVTTRMGWSTNNSLSMDGSPVTSVNDTGYIYNTYLPDGGNYYNVSVSGGGATHTVGLNNLHFRFTIDSYYFLSNEEINALKLEIKACIINNGMSESIDYAMLQVYNISTFSWHNVTSPITGNTYFKRYNDFSQLYTQTFSFAEIRQCIEPQDRYIWFRLQYYESSESNAANYGLNVSIDYMRLTVSSYTHEKKAIALLTQDFETFYMFTMSTGTWAATTTWTVSIDTSVLPKGIYALGIRTQTIFNGVNYNFTGRITVGGAMHTTQASQGPLFKNATLKVNPAGVVVALNPVWANKTVVRGKPAALAIQGTYSIAHGSLAAEDDALRLEFKQAISGQRYDVYKGSPLPIIDNWAFNLGSSSWWGNISFTRVNVWPSGLWYFRLWLQADDGAVCATEWQEVYLIAAPPLVSLEPLFPAVMDVWRATPTSNFVPMIVTDYDSSTFSAADVLLEAEDRDLQDQNFSIWSLVGATPSGSNTYRLSGTLNVSKNVANNTFNNFSLVASSYDSILPQTSVVRLTNTFHILNTFPQVTRLEYNTTTPFRNHDVNVTLEYNDPDDPLWDDVTVKNFSLKTQSGGVLALQKQDGDFLWTGTGTIRNAIFRFGNQNATGIYIANLTLIDPDSAETKNYTEITACNNLPVINTLEMTSDTFAGALLHNSGILVNRSKDKLDFTITLWDEEDSNLDDQYVSQVSIRLRHFAPTAAVNQYQPRYIALTVAGTTGGIQTWTITNYELNKADLGFGAGNVTVEVVAIDHDSGINTAYEAGGGMPDIIVINSAPFFFVADPVVVPAAASYTGSLNVSIACADAEGISEIQITFEGDPDFKRVAAVTATGSSHHWDINGTGWYVCQINLVAFMSDKQIGVLNVTRVTIYDTDRAVLLDDTTYGNTWTTREFNNKQTTIGDLPNPGTTWMIIIIVVVVGVVAVAAIYGVYYFRKKLSYRRYM